MPWKSTDSRSTRRVCCNPCVIFAVAPLWCLGRFGFPLPTSSAPIGWLSGVRGAFFPLPPIPNERFQVPSATIWASRNLFSPSTSHPYDVGQYFLASVVVDMIPNDLTNAPTPPTLPILEAMASRGPYASSFKQQCAWSRWLLGDPLSDAIGFLVLMCSPGSSCTSPSSSKT
jgi:hypothetical protein